MKTYEAPGLGHPAPARGAYNDEAECPAGHQFTVRRRAASAGFIVPTHCPECDRVYPMRAAEIPVVVRAKRLAERDIEARLVKRVEALGGEIRKVEWIGRRGAPDRVVMLPAKRPTIAELEKTFKVPAPTAAELLANWPPMQGRTIWVEVKAPGKAAQFPRNAHERAQQREHERMRAMGQRVELVDSFETIERILK